MSSLSARHALAGIALLMLGACASEKVVRSPAPPDTDWSQARTLTVKMTDFEFSPSHISLPVRVPIRLTLVNEGTDDHDFSAPTFFSAVMYRPGSVVSDKGNIELAQGQRIEVDILPVAVGTYKLDCTEFLHSMLGMTGKIEVTDTP